MPGDAGEVDVLDCSDDSCAERLSRGRRVLRRIYHRHSTIDGATSSGLDGRGKRGCHDTITTAKGQIRQSRHREHLFAYQGATGRIYSTKVDRIGMHRSDLGEQRDIGSSLRGLAAVA